MNAKHPLLVRLLPLTADGLPWAAEVYHSNPGYCRLYMGQPDLTLEELAAEFRSLASLPGARWRSIWAGNRLIGVAFLLLVSQSGDKSWLGRLLLHQDEQGKGYGRAAVQLLETEAAAQGVPSLHLGVIAEDEGSLRFWGKMGYEQYRLTREMTGGQLREVLWLAKLIGGGD